MRVFAVRRAQNSIFMFRAVKFIVIGDAMPPMWTPGSSIMIDAAETVSEALLAGRDGGSAASTPATQLLTTSASCSGGEMQPLRNRKELLDPTSVTTQNS